MVTSNSLYSQDPVYSQYYNAPLQLNPAFAGNNPNPFIAANVRVQWPAFSANYNTYSVSYDQYLPASNSGFGITLLNDSAGDGILKNTKISGIYSYNLKIDQERYIRGGVEVGMISRRLDWEKLVFGDAIDPQFGSISPGGTPYPSREIQPGNTNKTVFDLGAGLLYYSPKFFTGIAIDHINNPSDEFLTNDEKNYPGIPPRIAVHAGTEISIDINNKKRQTAFISPNILFVQQGAFTQVNGGIYGELGAFVGGLSYRYSNTNSDAVILSAGARMGYFKLVYSFDFTVSQLSISEGGAHELGMIYNMFDSTKKKFDINDCLNLFR